ncbi:hypothetical protein PO878_18150 [Iamia majanohamensis]|uniref:Uncharacterized protein n=1 Tax=Iamia majanohamensis TaxID=467976 RepID=A0AAE9Y4U2_9ACTN|nr:hypothetical protein [Iamia majanohamensis]WCO66424.1 hypothetical protein PO878_18150 [Iamia majanohamensis]
MRKVALTAFLALLATLFGLATGAPALACENDDGGALVGCGGTSPGAVTPGQTGTASSDGPPLPIDFEYYFDDAGEGVDAAPGYEEGCWGIRTVPEGEGTSYQEAVDQQAQQGENGVLWGNCRIEDTIDPAELAQILWERTVRPPPPTPLQVEPGRAVTGLRAYLEIGGEVPARQTIGTPIGPATFVMTPRYVVTWGDGATTETESQGVPWPGGPGEISHVYTDAGGVTVTVQAFWRTTWSLAGQGGDLPELPVPTEGSLDLPVEEYQVVTD